MSETFDQALKIGGLLNNQYRLDAILGEGGFGITYKAQDTQLDRPVVIKEFLPQDFAARSTDTKTVQARTNRCDDYEYGLKGFLEEAKTLAKFQHSHIAHVNTFFEANGTAYLVMTYTEGLDLNQWLKKHSEAVDEATILEIVTPIVDGLIKVHEAGLLHRDIKPGNIYLRKEGGAMLIDFGAARQALGEHSKSMSAIISVGYAPPEQYTTRGKQGVYTDLYAIGAVLYKLITGEPPVESVDRSHDMMSGGDDPLVPCVDAGKGKVSDWLCELTDQLLVLNPTERPQGANDVLVALKHKKNISSLTTSANDTDTRVVSNDDRFKTTSATKPAVKNNSDQGSRLKWVAMIIIGLVLAGGGVYVIQGAATKTLPKGNAILYLTTQPAGADIFLDDVALGTTPFKGDALPAGKHELRLDHPQYELEIKQITLKNNFILKQNIELKPATGNLSVFSVPDGAVIFIDGKNSKKKTPSTIESLKAGKRIITLKKDKYYLLKHDVTIAKGKTARVDLELKGGDLIQYKGEWMSEEEKSYHIMYEKGLSFEKKDEIKNAVHWYEQAVKGGLAKAQTALGRVYSDEDAGEYFNDAKAVYWYQKAADQGDARAQWYLADSYENGYGVKKNATQFVYWAEKAAEQGDLNALVSLGSQYLDGYYYEYFPEEKGSAFIEKDINKSLKWLKKTCPTGNENEVACKLLSDAVKMNAKIKESSN